MDDKRSINIFFNGSIYTKFNETTIVESIVTNKGKIEFTGSSKEAMRLYGKNADSIIDLEGRIVLPGFVDSHIHLDDLGSSLTYLNLRGTQSIKEMKERLLRYKLKNPDAKVIIGMGWDQESFVEGRWPNRSDIDEIVKDIPVFLERFCEHAGVINSKMLELADSNTFPDHVMPRAEDGKPTGVVKEEASSFFKQEANELVGNEEGNLVVAANFLLSQGVTSVGFVSCSLESAIYLSREASKLGIRVMAYLKEDAASKIDEIRRKVGENSFFKINGIKLFVDGALGARTAALREPYEDDTNNQGMLILDSRSLKKIFKQFEDNHVQFAIHAIGDRGIDTVIEAVSSMDRSKLLQPRIEHCTVLRRNHIKMLKELEIGISVQPAFVIDDWWAVKRLGKKRS
ncbi:MAG: amidohydrolase family protein, partial [Thermoplasmatales archaeon]